MRENCMYGSVRGLYREVWVYSTVNDLSEAGIKPSFALIDFKDITDDGSNSTHIVKNSESNWFTNTEQFKNKIAALTVNGGGDEPETPIDALEMARRLDTRSSSQKFIILITDANYKTNNNYEISSMNEMAELLKDDNINVSVISDTSYQAMYHTLYDTTGGVFADINGNFKAQLLTIADKIEEKTNDGYWILLEGLLPKIVKLDEKPDSAGTADTDGDGLLDREELKNVLPNKIVDVNYYYSILLKNTYETIGYKYSTIGVYQYNTDPTDKDTDKDSYNDFEDLMPLVPYKNPIILLHGWTDNTKNAFGLETKVTDENNNYGKQTADNDKEYSACSSHEITEITSGKLGAYLKNTKKYEENKNLFAFNYANQDMVYLNAAKLQAYVNDLISTAKMGNSDVVNQGYLFATKSNLNDSNVKFILVGHSMGGLVSRYYVENLSGESRIEKIITVDTPHYGSSLGNTSSALDFISYFMGKYNPGVFDLRTDSSLYGNGDTSWALTALYDYNMTYYALNHQSPALLGNANIETDYYSIAGYSIKSNNSAFDGTMYISYKLMKMIFAIKFINNTISKSDFYNTINNSLSNYSFQTVGEDSSVVFENIGSPGDDVVDIESQLGVKFDFWGNCVSYVNFKKSALIFDTTFSHNLLSNFHNDILNSEILFQQIGEFLND